MDQQVTNYTPMSVGEWIITLIVTYIPIVGLIMLFVWAFGGDTHPSKKTWAQATLIMIAIMIVLSIIFFSIIASVIGGIFSNYSSSYS
ncbi:MAG: hypothetical protein HKM87_11300 [Ignavibacteriaceae bacterium]|nr:hypothetical protein [Ignavibacteriaceae bacterium]